MIDDNPFEASTLAVVPDMSPEERVFGPMPLPDFVPSSVMDPVSNLDFPPVDDAFALEMRSETIEQLVGGDALRRGESERIEAGRSQTNADLVAGRDRVRVQDTLHEHTGHGLNEQATHLHITVDGTLDVHAASEDTVLLAGYLRDRWDGGAAIVAAMTDDTVAGGGIRVTTPLDLWVHGLMGVEERIGTCTADAVLLELGATHYEREYGPGVHAAGLAVYTGSLYQSSRSTFRPLMRVSSGVRNLIAGGGGGGGGGNGGAGSAPGASPPLASAAGGAGTQAASETLCAATGAGGSAQAGGMAGVRSQDLTGIHRGDEVAALAGGAHVAGTSGDLTELRRGEDTAGQLAALRDAMRGGEAGPQREVTSVSRVPGLDDTASVHEASAADIMTDIRSGATVPGMDTPVLNSTVSPPQPPPGVKLGLLGGADRPPRPAAPESDVPAVNRRLRDLRRHFTRRSSAEIRRDLIRATQRVGHNTEAAFQRLGGKSGDLAKRPPGTLKADHAYRVLQETAEEAELGNDFDRAGAIRKALEELDERAVEELQALCTKHAIAQALSTRAMPQSAETAQPAVKVETIPPPALAIRQCANWIPAYTRVRDLICRFRNLHWKNAHRRPPPDFFAAAKRMSHAALHKFRQVIENSEHLHPSVRSIGKSDQAYQALVDMLTQRRRGICSGAAPTTCSPSRATSRLCSTISASLSMRPSPGARHSSSTRGRSPSTAVANGAPSGSPPNSTTTSTSPVSDRSSPFDATPSRSSPPSGASKPSTASPASPPRAHPPNASSPSIADTGASRRCTTSSTGASTRTAAASAPATARRT